MNTPEEQNRKVNQLAEHTFGAFHMPWPRKPLAGKPKGAAKAGGHRAPAPATKHRSFASKRRPFGNSWPAQQ